METCPRCNNRPAAMTLRAIYGPGQFTLCHVCAIQGGYADAIKVAHETQELERMAKISEANCVGR